MGRALARLSGVEPLRLRWTKLAGPHFGNAVGSLVHSGRGVYVSIEATGPRADLVRVMHAELAVRRSPEAVNRGPAAAS